MRGNDIPVLGESCLRRNRYRFLELIFFSVIWFNEDRLRKALSVVLHERFNSNCIENLFQNGLLIWDELVARKMEAQINFPVDAMFDLSMLRFPCRYHHTGSGVARSSEIKQNQDRINCLMAKLLKCGHQYSLIGQHELDQYHLKWDFKNIWGQNLDQNQFLLPR